MKSLFILGADRTVHQEWQVLSFAMEHKADLKELVTWLNEQEVAWCLVVNKPNDSVWARFYIIFEDDDDAVHAALRFPLWQRHFGDFRPEILLRLEQSAQ